MGERMEKDIRNIVVFGTGQGAQRRLPSIEKNGRILFCVDNDTKKWGKKFGKYPIKSPNDIESNESDVVIAVSEQYVKEIYNQLLQMGINDSRLYLCRRLPLSSDEMGIYPINPDYIQETGLTLIQYDLLASEEKETNCKKVMVFCKFYSVYTKQLIENISKRYEDIEFSLLTSAVESAENIICPHLKHIYCFQTLDELKTILLQLPVYDAMQLLWIEWEWSYFYHLIRSKTRRLNLNVGGSEFYRATPAQRDFKKNLIEKADRITAETKETVKNFQEYYGAIAQKTDLLPFGVEILDIIKKNTKASSDNIKKKFGIPANKIVVTCGHNANRAHQHGKIIEAVSKLREDIKEQLVFVFPMTYNQVQEEYIHEIADSLEQKRLEHVILTKFMNFQEMAEYATISDIMIHVQTTDQLSSTMLEEMYAGSIVVAGSWLPYKTLHEMGIYFLDVDSVADVTEVLQNVVLNIEEHRKRCVKNSEVVWRHSSWDELASKWHRLWE